MAQLICNGQPALTINDANRVLAHLHAVAWERFAQGKGFFVTILGSTNGDAEPMGPRSVWLHPSIALQIQYDPGDPVELRPDLLEAFRKAMSDPVGITIGPDAGAIEWPLIPRHTEREFSPGRAFAQRHNGRAVYAAGPALTARRTDDLGGGFR